MSTAIVYYSRHHGNTKKLIDAIAARHDVRLIDATTESSVDLTQYCRIGFASGVYFGALAKPILALAEKCLPEHREVFYIYTHGAPKGDFLKEIRRIADARACREIGEYRCLGYDTFGPFKLVGGLAKGHPTPAEIEAAVEFYERL